MAIAEASAMPRLQQTYMPNLGAALAGLGSTDEALEVLERHRALAQAVGESLSPLYSAAAMARIHLGRGDITQARQAAEEGEDDRPGRGGPGDPVLDEDGHGEVAASIHAADARPESLE